MCLDRKGGSAIHVKANETSYFNLIQTVTFQVMIPCNHASGYQHLGRTCCLHLLPWLSSPTIQHYEVCIKDWFISKSTMTSHISVKFQQVSIIHINRLNEINFIHTKNKYIHMSDVDSGHVKIKH
jgi:hypothetical protein